MEDFDMEIDSRLLDNDFDDVEYNPIVIDDSDNEASEMFGY